MVNPIGFGDLEVFLRVILTQAVEGRPATQAEREHAHGAVRPWIEALAAHLFAGNGVASAWHDGQDVGQEFWVLTSQSVGKFDTARSAKAFAYGIVRVLCVVHARRNRRVSQLPSRFDSQADGCGPLDQQMLQEVMQFVLVSATALSKKQREAIEDQFEHGLTAPQAADKRGISVRSVESARHRARTSLRLAVKKADLDD